MSYGLQTALFLEETRSNDDVVIVHALLWAPLNLTDQTLMKKARSHFEFSTCITLEELLSHSHLLLNYKLKQALQRLPEIK